MGDIEEAVVRTLADLVPIAARRRPEAVALEDRHRTLTWRELERSSSAIARHLGALGVEPGARVGIHRHKDVTAFEAIHGILRAGAVVVPVDPRATAPVAAQVLADAEVSCVVVDDVTGPRLGDRAGVPVLWAPGPAEPTTDDGARRAREWETVVTVPAADLPPVGPDDPAYVIYTSGSTGVPKGIVHTHRSALAYAEMVVDLYGLGTDDRVAGMNPFHFDMSTLELYAAPLAGSSVVVMSETDLQFPASFTERADAAATTLWYGVPFFLRQLVGRGVLGERRLGSLRWLLYGGEPFPPAALAELMDALPGARVSNVYGPAEVNQCTHHHLDEPPEAAIPLGRPTRGVEIRLLDDEGDEVPAGVQGELHVAAPTMCEGYWRRPDLDHSRFRTVDGTRWYATGDLAELDHDGLLWGHGRRDHQVKLRGVRIELEAVENVLGDADGVLHAVVGPIRDRSGQMTGDLAAAVVAEPGAEPDPRALRRWCRSRLPAVAVPAEFHLRPHLPVTGSGKIDRSRVRGEFVANQEEDRLR